MRAAPTSGVRTQGNDPFPLIRSLESKVEGPSLPALVSCQRHLQTGLDAPEMTSCSSWKLLSGEERGMEGKSCQPSPASGVESDNSVGCH